MAVVSDLHNDDDDDNINGFIQHFHNVALHLLKYIFYNTIIKGKNKYVFLTMHNKKS